MSSLTKKYLDELNFSQEDAAALRDLGECKGKQELFERQKPEVLEGLTTVAKIESTDASNRLEGIVAPDARLRQLVLHETNPRNRPEQEIAGYRDALELLHDSRKDIPVAVNVIQQLHQRIYSFMPSEGGYWKLTDNQIVEYAADGSVARVRFNPTPAVSTGPAMDELVALYQQAAAEGKEPLVVIPLVVLDFLCIHPFQDGNGRVARLLTLLLLYHHDYEVGRYISLERIFENSKESYYETLEASSQGWHEDAHNPHPWLTYFWGVLRKAYREFEERVGSLEKGRGSKSQQVRNAVQRTVRSFTISDIERECPGVSKETIRSVLRQLKQSGVVVLRGRGRGARWRKARG